MTAHRSGPCDDLVSVLLDWLARQLADRLPPRRPLPVSVQLVREEKGMLVYALTLPPAGAPDVVRRVITQTVNGGEPTEFDATDGMEVRYNDNDQVVLTLRDIDDAGNESAPSDPFAFTATDTIAPPQPGQVGLTLVREE